MAIVKGLEQGAILWKYTTERQAVRYNPNTSQRENVTITYYHLLRLRTRRARSLGERVRAELYPMLSALKINLHPWATYRSNRTDYYTAIGTYIERCSKEDYDRAEIDEVASRHYRRIKNASFAALLENQVLDYSGQEDVQKLKTFAEECATATQDSEDEINWPEEPNLRQYNMDSDFLWYQRQFR